MRKTAITIIKFILSAVLTLGCAAALIYGHMYYHMTETMDPDIPQAVSADFLKLDIYIDGRHYNNWQFERPFLVYNSSVYVPVDEELNLDVNATETPIYDLEGMSLTIGIHRIIDGKPAGLTETALDGQGREYVAVGFLKELGRLDAEYDRVGGLYISTNRDISAKKYLENDTNKSYIEGIAAYIIRCNPVIDKDTAQYYEYLIRHCCCENPPCSENLVVSVIRRESNFNAEIGTFAVGMMQVLEKYAAKHGYAREQLLDPHINIHYGCRYLAANLKSYRGDELKALTAYNKGAASLLAEEGYDTVYAESVLETQRGLVYWLKQNGYDTQFTETIEINE